MGLTVEVMPGHVLKGTHIRTRSGVIGNVKACLDLPADAAEKMRI